MMTQIVKTIWTSDDGKVRVDFLAGEDGGKLVFRDALHFTAAEYAATDAAAITATAETRYANWKAAVDAASNYVMTKQDWLDREAAAQAQIDRLTIEKAEAAAEASKL
jgi:hypothetical protein